jgi:hypothetical protein
MWLTREEKATSPLPPHRPTAAASHQDWSPVEINHMCMLAPHFAALPFRAGELHVGGIQVGLGALKSRLQLCLLLGKREVLPHKKENGHDSHCHIMSYRFAEIGSRPTGPTETPRDGYPTPLTPSQKQ